MKDFVFFEMELGSGVEFVAKVLGKNFGFNIHGIDAFIELPQISSSLTHATYSNEKYLLTPESVRGRYGKDLDWGMVTAIDKKDIIEVFVKKAILVLPFTNQEEGEKIISKLDAIEKSIKIFMQYLSIYTKKSFGYKYNDRRPDIKYVAKKELRQQLNKKFNNDYPLVGYVHQTSYKAIDSDLINKILNYVGELKDPPLSYQLLIEARSLFYQQKYRSTVFECASAAEVLLKVRLVKHINKRNDVFEKKLLSRCEGDNVSVTM